MKSYFPEHSRVFQWNRRLLLACTTLVLLSPSPSLGGVEGDSGDSAVVADENLFVDMEPVGTDDKGGSPGVAKLETVKVSLPSSVTTNLISVAARFDTSYAAGGAISQGFAVPSARVSVFGNALKHVDYRFSMGQTREFSTAALPQLLPVEAFVNVLSEANSDEAHSLFRFRVGMFTPLMNPLWTPDLSEVDLPDYHESHRALFLSRDIGAELAVRPWGERLELGVGVFNGTGIFSLNTNNGKAFNGYARLNLPAGDFRFELGTGNYVFSQSSPGSVNYKSSYASDLFIGVEYLPLKTRIFAEAFSTHFEDSTRSQNPTGMAGVIHLSLAQWLKLYARIENANSSPILAGAIRHYQFGPEFVFTQNFKAFLTYQQLEAGGSRERIMLIRIRLTV